MKAAKNILSGRENVRQFLHLFFFTLAILLINSACDDANLISQTRDLKAAKVKWEEVNINDYRAEIERLCFCGGPFRYTMSVNNGEIVEVLDSETGEAVENLGGYSTIDELFTWLEQVATQDPQKLELEFHPKLGYPTLIDYNQSDNIADEELLLRINDFEKN